MIPIKLQLKNFLSYGPGLQTVDFSAYSLICFSGKNGHGKSALLDAITWAIWGYARKTTGAAKADQGLLRLGQTNMMVCLDFYCNNMHYRIRRELTIRHNKPVAALDYGIVQEDGSVSSLTDKTIRATQYKIEQTLKIDFESFCNSAFLRQGQSSEFCKKSPKDRKEILIRILGLEQYETIRRLAMDKAKKALLEQQQLTLLKETIEAEVKAEDTIQRQQAETHDAIETIGKTINTAHTELSTKKTVAENLLQQKNKYAVDIFALEQTSKQITALQSQLIKVRNQWRTTHKQYIQTLSQYSLQDKLSQVRTACAHYQELLQKGLRLKEQFLQKKNELQTFISTWKKSFYDTIQQEKNTYNTSLVNQKQYETQHTYLLKKQTELLTHKNQLEAELCTVTTRIQEIELLKPAFEQSKKQLNKRKEYYQRYSAAKSLRTAQQQELTQKQLLACKTETASCPLCEQTVTASRRRFLNAKFTTKQQHIAHKIDRLSRVLVALKPVVIEQHAQLEPIQKKIHEQSTHEATQKELRLKITLLQKEQNTLSIQISDLHKTIAAGSAVLKKQYAGIIQLEQSEATQLQKQDQYTLLKNEILTYEKEAKALGYNTALHKEKEEEKKHLIQLAETQQNIISQLPLQHERKKHIHDLCAQLRALKAEKARLFTCTAHAQKIENSREALKQEIVLIEQKLNACQLAKEKLLQNKGSLENQYKKIEAYKSKYKEVQSAITQKMISHQEFTAIAHAMSKDGIQALLIEDAIPEIEYEANELLSRLTHNQAHIIIESVKDLKSGGTKETLDIFISDALGLRPYELFSGGEAFRIDFALRIAISKLVARRAGTALQTLIIDEGFGSQDEEGLSLMLEALYKIQNDFEKIIVVSHLPFMKDHFPVHFNIEKGPMGSSVSVLQQG